MNARTSSEGRANVGRREEHAAGDESNASCNGLTVGRLLHHSEEGEALCSGNIESLLGYVPRPANPMAAQAAAVTTTQRDSPRCRSGGSRANPRREWPEKELERDRCGECTRERPHRRPKAPCARDQEDESRRDVCQLEGVPTRKPYDNGRVATQVTHAHEGERHHRREREQHDEGDRDILWGRS